MQERRQNNQSVAEMLEKIILATEYTEGTMDKSKRFLDKELLSFFP